MDPHKVRQRKNSGFPGNSGRSPVSKRGASRFAASKPDGDVLPSSPPHPIYHQKKSPQKMRPKPGFQPFESERYISYTKKWMGDFPATVVSHVTSFQGVLKRMCFFLREPLTKTKSDLLHQGHFTFGRRKTGGQTVCEAEKMWRLFYQAKFWEKKKRKQQLPSLKLT